MRDPAGRGPPGSTGGREGAQVGDVRDRPRGTRRFVTVLLAAAVAAAAAAAIVTPLPARAQSGPDAPRVTADDLGLEARAGFSGHALRGRATPVEVRIAPDRLIAGELRVASDVNGRRQVEVRDVEVAAGSAKVFRFVTPPTSAMSVELVTGDGTVRARVEADTSGRYLVGVVGESLPASVPPVQAPGFDVRADVVPIDPVWLDLGPHVLDSLAALVIDRATLDGLADEAVGDLATWVAGGGSVVVTVDDGPVSLPLPWNPATGAEAATVAMPGGRESPASAVVPAGDAWPLTVDDVTGSGDATVVAAARNAGHGRVAVVGVDVGEGELGGDGALWGALVPPRGVLAQFDEAGPTARILDVAPQTLQTGSIDLPGIVGLAVFLIAYVLVVGPINGLVLSRLGRRELAWGTIPAITLVFATVAWVGAGSTSPSVGLSGNAAWWVDGVGGETAVVGLRSPRPGTHEVALPGQGWTPMSGSWNRPAAIDRASGDTVVGMDLEALELGSTVAMRAVPGSPPLEVEVTDRRDGLTVEVRNVGTVAVDEVTVRAGTLAEAIGTLAPGESGSATLRDPQRLRRRNAWEDEIARDIDGVPRSPGSLEAVLRWQVLDHAPGIVWATGTVPAGLPGLAEPLADGVATTPIGTFLAVGTTAEVADGPVLPVDTHRGLVVAGFGEVWRPSPWAVEGQLEAVLRYRLPRVDGLTALVSTLGAGELFADRGMDACFTVEVRDEDGALLSAMETCGDPRFPEPPPCPPDVASCAFDPDTMVLELCDADGACREATVEAIGVPEVTDGDGRLQILDVTTGEWVLVDEVFDDDRAPTERFVSPLGEVLVRVQGQLHPFEFSGRGLAAEPRQEARR